MSVDRRLWPAWVQLGLWGMPTRWMAWFFCTFALLGGIAGIVYGFVNPPGFWAGLLLLAALWYYLAIRWVGRNSRWS